MLDSFFFACNGVLPLLAVILLGMLLNRRGMLDGGFIQKGNQLCYRILMPMSLFRSLYGADFSTAVDGRLFLFVLGSVALTGLLAFLLVPLFERDRRRRSVETVTVFRGNYIIFATVVYGNLFGEESLAASAALTGPLLILYNVMLVLAFELNSGSREGLGARVKHMLLGIVKNPLIQACVLGLIFSLLRIPVPQVLDSTVATLAKATTPVALLLLGASFHVGELRRDWKPALLITLIKQALIPAAALYAAVLLGFTGSHLGLILCIFCAPVAVALFNITMQYKADTDLASSLIVTTTTLSMFSVLVSVMLLRSAGLL